MSINPIEIAKKTYQFFSKPKDLSEKTNANENTK